MKKCRNCGTAHRGTKHRWSFKTGKVKGGYGETDFGKKTITIDKSKHKRSSYKRITPNKDGSENMLVTMAHELMHKAHPSWSEKKVESAARKKHKRMSKSEKSRVYSKFK